MRPSVPACRRRWMIDRIDQLLDMQGTVDAPYVPVLR